MSLIKKMTVSNSSRYRLWQENEAFAALVPCGALVLDAGAGKGPYRSLFDHAIYESADFEQVDKEYQESTYVCDLKQIPVEDSRYDYIIFNQVMEHLPEPGLVLNELRRVLKPGGKVLYTGPLFYEEHEKPHDYYRYTQFGLRYLFESAGYNIDRIDWLEGYFGTVGYQLKSMARHLPYAPGDINIPIIGYVLMPIMLVFKTAFFFLSILFHKLEIISKCTKAGYPKNYLCIVSKVDQGAGGSVPNKEGDKEQG